MSAKWWCWADLKGFPLIVRTTSNSVAIGQISEILEVVDAGMDLALVLLRGELERTYPSDVEVGRSHRWSELGSRRVLG
jgi:hypothetical protein